MKNKIDLVYLWVDGNDKKWLAKKNLWLNKYGKLSKSANITARFRDNDELKYSLRSVEKFVPWINHIFLVTDNQIPKWLNTKNKKISVIDLSQIMPKDSLPVFNSIAIESCLHNIPNLSEHFLYSNDDMFFGSEIKPSYFFDENENPIVIVKRKWLPKNSFAGHGYEKYWNARKAYNKFLHKARGIVYTLSTKKYFCEPSHNITPMRKSYAKDTVKKLPEIFNSNIYSRFRDTNNTERFLYSIYDNCVNRCTLVMNNNIGYTKRIYDFKRTDGFLYSIRKLFYKQNFETFDGANIRKKIIKYQPKLFCINDGPSSGEKTLNANKKFLQEMFPKKSTFEN
ncbi:MAG: Stealth CR1 domain-containing protein [Rickettsiales bacterium]|jgi:hypothetical protein|nr:Stealth CR1 domain-containing protein [Rickettsiales bacterium]